MGGTFQRPKGRAPRSAALLVAAVFLAAGCIEPQSSAPPLEPDDFLLGGIPPESDSVEIRATFGDPDSVVVSENPFDAFEPIESWHYDGFVIRFSGSAYPMGYLLTGGFERTLRGIRVGDTGDEVLRRYGAPSFRHDPVWTYVDPMDTEGTHVLEFLVEEDTVRRIHIGRGS